MSTAHIPPPQPPSLSSSSSSLSERLQDRPRSTARADPPIARDSMSAVAASTQLLALDPHQDARALIRIIQCPRCSHPLRTPVTLPCGNSICRQCLPAAHQRQHITYMALENRQSGITCPVPQCRKEHPLDDCSVNVALINLMESMVAALHSFDGKLPPFTTSMTEIPAHADLKSTGELEKEAEQHEPHTLTSPGGRLLGTFAFASSGKLGYLSEVEYAYDPAVPDAEEQSIANDDAVLAAVIESSQKDLDCQICYNLMLDPCTTPCGHTWCRKCLARILDHSRLCPVCRRTLFIPSSLVSHPNNQILDRLLVALVPEKLAVRKETELQDESHQAGLDTAIFVCTLSFPAIPTYLHIFEPRYRLMIRRAIEANGQFGMVAYNQSQSPQGHLGPVHFMQYGTMLQIIRYQILPDGRSFVECKGLHRFRILTHDTLDGYMVGRVEKLEDIPLSEEERIESEETSVIPASEEEAAASALDRMPTSEMLRICQEFVDRNRESAARWLQTRILEAYGEPPDDPATFPYWLASVLPMNDAAKYSLLPLTSARERLKMVVRWIHEAQASQWYRGSTCNVL